MRIQKIRGNKRRQNQIEKWRLGNLDLRVELLQLYQYDKIDIRIHPWCNISFLNSIFPEPKGKNKQLILNGLIDIYNSLKSQLEQQGLPYYLKIWLFEPRFSRSQVVCAIGERIEYYNNSFNSSNEKVSFHPESYGLIKDRLGKFTWELKDDEDYYSNNELGEADNYVSIEVYEETKKWFNKLLKKPHRTEIVNDPEVSYTELYSFKRGRLWIGEIK